MGNWTSRDLVTESLTPTGTDFNGTWQGGFQGMFGTVYLDGSVKKVGSYSIRHEQSGSDWALLEYEFDVDTDLTGFDYAEFYVKVPLFASLDSFQFYLMDDDWNTRRWYITDYITNGEWIYIRIDLNNPTESDSGFDITKIEFMEISPGYTSVQSSVIYVDGITFYKGINWIGAGADEYWATSGNWEGGNVPDIAGEAATFSNAQSSKSCIIQSSDTPPGLIETKSDYTGTITFPSDWASEQMDAYIAGGTYGAGFTNSCRNLRVTGGYIAKNIKVNGFKVYVSGSGIILDGYLGFFGSEDVDVELYQTGMMPADPRIDGFIFGKNGTINLLTDAYSDYNIELGDNGVTTVINVGSHTLFCRNKIDSYVNDLVNYSILFASGGMLWVNGNGDNNGEDFFAADGSNISIGVSGGVPWNYKSGTPPGTTGMTNVGYYPGGKTTYVNFYGPSEGGVLDFYGRNLAFVCNGIFKTYGGQIKARGLYVGSDIDFDLDLSDLEISGKLTNDASWLPPGVEEHSVLSVGTYSAGVLSSLTITTPENNVIQGISAYNTAINSGGVGVTVTASGCAIKGSIDISTGDNLVFGAGTTWEEAKVKWIGLGANDYWGTPANWQLGHIPEVDDIAWFKGTAVRKCRINAATAVPVEILVEADYTGSLAEINNNVSGWGNPALKLTVLGSRSDNFKLGASSSAWKYFGDVYVERGYLGYNQNVSIYGSLYFAGNGAKRLIAMGTNDRIWEFHTQNPWIGISPPNFVTDLYFYHLDCNVTVKGELYLSQWLSYGIDIDSSEGYSPEGHTKTVTYDNDTILYTGLTTEESMAWFGLLDQLNIKMSPGVAVQHLYSSSSNKSYPGWFMVGNEDSCNVGASGSGLWDFDGYFSGEWAYGGYAHRQYFGYCVGCMDRWHHKPAGSYTTFYGMAPGHHFKAYNTGLHIEKYGHWLSYGGDIEVEFFEINENGYFDQGNGKLIITGKSKIVITDQYPYAPGEPYDDCLWAVWSKGTWVWTPGASVEIRSDVDVKVLGAELPNLLIDSGGIGITVTASGCKFYGEPEIAAYDKLIIEDDTIIVKREIAPPMQVSSQVGEDLIYQIDVEMEGDG